MKRFLQNLSLAVVALLGVAILASPPQPALAYNPLDSACTKGGDSAACSAADQSSDPTGPNGIVIRATRLIAGVAGVAAVIMMIIYGIQLATSYGDSGKATSARNGIIAACVGLVIIILSQAIVVFVISNI